MLAAVAATTTSVVFYYRLYAIVHTLYTMNVVCLCATTEK